jgi:hypothetical protein
MGRNSATSEHVQAVAESILEAFRTGKLPKALAQVFLNPTPEDSPTRRWSWRNRLLVALRGERDARGFRQWKQVGRSVKKGARAFRILGPVTRRTEEVDEATGELEQTQKVVGFVAIPVFGLSQTEGKPLPDPEIRFLEALPLLEVARAWDIEVTTVPFHPGVGSLGTYRPGRITLSVENLSTWGHELVHAADDRLGAMRPSPKQQREVVAELGGAVLLECLGYETESDRGGAWDYIQGHTETPAEAFRLSSDLLERTSAAVALILETARELEALGGTDTPEPQQQSGPQALLTPAPAVPPAQAPSAAFPS